MPTLVTQLPVQTHAERDTSPPPEQGSESTDAQGQVPARDAVATWSGVEALPALVAAEPLADLHGAQPDSLSPSAADAPSSPEVAEAAQLGATRSRRPAITVGAALLAAAAGAMIALRPAEPTTPSAAAAPPVVELPSTAQQAPTIAMTSPKTSDGTPAAEPGDDAADEDGVGEDPEDVGDAAAGEPGQGRSLLDRVRSKDRRARRFRPSGI